MKPPFNLANRALYSVKDLNEKTSLEEVGSESIDIEIFNVSVDYLVKPIMVFEEMRRVLKVGRASHMAFSNPCFPTKVIGSWMGMSDEERKWVGGYFWACGGWEELEEEVVKESKRGYWRAAICGQGKESWGEGGCRLTIPPFCL